jgi:glutamyl-tRNA reductase
MSAKIYNLTVNLFVIGLNHTTTPLDVRGRFFIPPENLHQALNRARARFPCGLTDAVIVSTCNRVELYVAAQTWNDADGLAWLCELGQCTESVLRPYIYIWRGEQAVRHAFRVACGLDSMVLGEPQILGQLKWAVRESLSAGTLNGQLHQMFQRSFAVAKTVRSSTQIGMHSVSMAAAGTRLAAQLFEDLKQTRVLLVGAGEMIGVVAQHFASQKPLELCVVNRTWARAEQLAQSLGGKALQWSELTARLAEFDIVISCTTSSLPIIGLGAVERAIKLRRHRPMFMLDLAVPRDIEAEVARLHDVYLYTLDDLSARVQVAGDKRQAAVAQAEILIEKAVLDFGQWFEQRASVPLIQALHTQVDHWRALEINRAQKLLSKGESIATVLEALSKGLAQKMLHGTLSELQTSQGESRAQLVQTVSHLFLKSSPSRHLNVNAREVEDGDFDDADPSAFSEPLKPGGNLF